MKQVTQRPGYTARISIHHCSSNEVNGSSVVSFACEQFLCSDGSLHLAGD